MEERDQDEATTGRVGIPLIFDLDAAPAMFANHFIAQFQRDEYYLTIGQVVPPPLTGATQEERIEQAQQIEGIRLHTLGRFSFTRSRLDELIKHLTEIRDKADVTASAEEKEG